MGASCSANRKSTKDTVSVCHQSLDSLSEGNPTLSEMGFGAEISRQYDAHEKEGSSQFRLTKKQAAKEEQSYVLKRATSDSPIFLMKWHQTIDLLSSLDHPNLPKVMDVYDDDGCNNRVSFVLQACEGGHLLEKHAFYSEQQARKVVRQVLEVVQYLHNHNVVHGDLRAEIFSFRSRDAKDHRIQLTNFSLAHYQPQQPNRRRRRQPLRIQHDRAPSIQDTAYEVAFDGKAHSPKSDAWSVGVLLFRLLSGGHRPFGETPDEVVAYFREEGPTLSFSRQRVWKTVSPAAKDLIKKLLIVDPSHRLSVRQALQHRWFSSFLPNHSLRTSLSRALSKPSSRRSTSFKSVGVAA